MLGVVASLFGLLLAFVVVIEFQAFSSAQDNVQAEADDLAAIVRDSYAFDGESGASVRASIGEYVSAVIDDEWPLMRDGEESAAAWSAIDGMFAAMQAYEPTSASEASFYDDSVRHLNTLLESRRDRLGASGSNDLPGLIAALILVGAVVILGYAVLVGSKSSGFHAIGAGSIAVIVGFSLVSCSRSSSRSPAALRSTCARSMRELWGSSTPTRDDARRGTGCSPERDRHGSGPGLRRGR